MTTCHTKSNLICQRFQQLLRVHQGPILGPILFHIHINKPASLLLPLLFADDTALTECGPNLPELVNCFKKLLLA